MLNLKNLNFIVIAILVGVIGLGAGFFGGMKYQQSQPRTNAGNFNGQRTANGTQMMGNRTGFRPVNGQIISTGDNTITVKLTDGSSKIVMLSGTTNINKAGVATTADLTTGITVAVIGQTNTDGSVSAQNIQINPQSPGRISDK